MTSQPEIPHSEKKRAGAAQGPARPAVRAPAQAAMLVDAAQGIPVPAPRPVVDGIGQAGGRPGAGSAMHAESEAERKESGVLSDLLSEMLELGASDLHLSSGNPPLYRIKGELRRIEGEPLKPEQIQRMLYAILTQKQREIFEAELELDMSYPLPGKARFRVNCYRQRASMGAAFRLIPFEIKSLEQLGIPAHASQFARLPRGLVLVTGPTGSGKSTTLAAMIDIVNSETAQHIMTIEDPIEFLHHHKKSAVHQRELGADTHSFAKALKHVLRQDPDVILVGEMRDLETIQLAITAAETGHLVFATLHTNSAPSSVDRMIDVFPPHQQQQIRIQLASSLQGVVTQTLLPTADGKGRVAACEILVVTPAVSNLIREGKTHQIFSAMQAGGATGMQTMDKALAKLVSSGKVRRQDAEEKAHDPENLNQLLRKTAV